MSDFYTTVRGIVFPGEAPVIVLLLRQVRTQAEV